MGIFDEFVGRPRIPSGVGDLFGGPSSHAGPGWEASRPSQPSALSGTFSGTGVAGASGGGLMGGLAGFVDRDNDGAVMDDMLKFGVQAAGTYWSTMGRVGSAVSPFLGPVGRIVAPIAGAAQKLGDFTNRHGVGAAEEAGDFMTDAMGWRRAPWRPGEATTDPHYAAGRTDGMGQQLNRWIDGNVPPGIPLY